MSDQFIDFEYMGTYNKSLILNGIRNNQIKRLASLNQLGYYFFIIKLTVYLMRKEDRETQKERNREAAFE